MTTPWTAEQKLTATLDVIGRIQSATFTTSSSSHAIAFDAAQAVRAIRIALRNDYVYALHAYRTLGTETLAALHTLADRGIVDAVEAARLYQIAEAELDELRTSHDRHVDRDYV